MKKRVRRTKDLSQEKILKATFKLIQQHGWTGLSFQAIGKKCGMSTANILYHFKSREALLVSLLQVITLNNWNIVSGAMRPDFNSFQRLCVHFEKNLEWAENYPEQAQIILHIYAEAGHNKEFADLFKTMITKAQDRIEEYLLAGQREKLFQLPLSTNITAKYLHNVLIGGFTKIMGGRLTGQFSHSPKEWNAILKNLVNYKES